MRYMCFIVMIVLGGSMVGMGQNLPEVVAGRVQRISDFQSAWVTPRNVDIWLPDGYPKAGKYAVLYMHDGQMLFDASSSWNKQAWEVDDVASALISEGAIRDFIVVGIWNGGITRHADYFPQRPYELLSQQDKEWVVKQLQQAGRTTELFQPKSDAYLKFIVQELKPYIDAHFEVDPGQQSTFMAGSSMGGLISMYAICEYPGIFGGAICMSTHWVGTFTLENNPIPASFIRYMNDHLPSPQTHKIYFDCGDQTLDALYPEIQKQVDHLMQEKGYTESNWQTRYFPGQDHSEKAWQGRFHLPLRFILKRLNS